MQCYERGTPRVESGVKWGEDLRECFLVKVTVEISSNKPHVLGMVKGVDVFWRRRFHLEGYTWRPERMREVGGFGAYN